MTDTEDYSELISIDELCKALMVGKSTAYSLLRNGSIKAFKIGRIWKIPKGSVPDFIQTNSISTFK